jgi:hypothetical protein
MRDAILYAALTAFMIVLVPIMWLLIAAVWAYDIAADLVQGDRQCGPH